MQSIIDYKLYFMKSLEFMVEHHWLIDFAVTDILVSDVFSKVPSNWMHHFKSMTYSECISLAHESLKPEWPESLGAFLNKCNELKLESIISVTENGWHNIEIDKKFNRGLSPKKLCEVESLSGLVDLICRQSSCEGVIDIGSGLGYLDRILAAKGYNVLGIECNEALIQKATCQIQKISSNLSERIAYHHMKMDEQSVTSFLQTVQTFESKNNIRRLCMVGLHTCGDLASSALRNFLSIPSLTTAIIMPCCYHKLNFVDNPRFISSNAKKQLVFSSFKNFPLSETLSLLFNTSSYKEIFFRPFLRLASQENYYRWKGWTETDHEINAFNVLCRALLQLYVTTEGLHLKKSYRRIINKNICTDFASFIDGIWECFEFIDKLSNKVLNCDTSLKNKISTDLLLLWEKYKDCTVLIEIILILQMSMQSLVETFIIMDFLCFLNENSVENLKVAKLCDSKISPRNFALIASKVNL